MHMAWCAECRMMYERLVGVKRMVRERAPRPEVPASLWAGAAARFEEVPRRLGPISLRSAAFTGVATMMGVLTVFAVSWGALRPTRQPAKWLNVLRQHYVQHRASQPGAPALSAVEASAFPVDLKEFALVPVEAKACDIGGLPAYCYVYRSADKDCYAVITRIQGLCQKVAGACPGSEDVCGCLKGTSGDVKVIAWPAEGGGCVCLSVKCRQANLCRLSHVVARAVTARR